MNPWDRGSPSSREVRTRLLQATRELFAQRVVGSADRLHRLFADVAATISIAPVDFSSLNGELERELAVRR